MQKRHWQQPLVTGSQSKEVLMSEANKATLKNEFGFCALRKPVTSVQKLAGF
jgi:hypothetical protein